jgi:hypothetical protein
VIESFLVPTVSGAAVSFRMTISMMILTGDVAFVAAGRDFSMGVFFTGFFDLAMELYLGMWEIISI